MYIGAFIRRMVNEIASYIVGIDSNIVSNLQLSALNGNNLCNANDAHAYTSTHAHKHIRT